MSEFLPADPKKDPVETLRRSFRRFQVFVLLGLVAMAGFLYWQGRQNRMALGETLRPIVVLRDIKFLPVQRGNSGLYWQFVAIWQNAGVSAARNVQTHVHYWTGPVTPGFSHMTPNDFGGQPFDLGARESINTPDFMVPAPAMAGAKASSGELVIWGGATYHEARSGGRPHITHFCYLVTWIGGDPNNAALPLDVRTNWCTEGNCTDDECRARGYADAPPDTPARG